MDLITKEFGCHFWKLFKICPNIPSSLFFKGFRHFSLVHMHSVFPMAKRRAAYGMAENEGRGRASPCIVVRASRKGVSYLMAWHNRLPVVSKAICTRIKSRGDSVGDSQQICHTPKTLKIIK